MQRQFWRRAVLGGLMAGLVGAAAAASTVSGDKFGDEFIVTTTTRDSQINPRVASDAAGNFVVVWTDLTKDQDLQPVLKLLGQLYTAAGRKRGGEFLIEDGTLGGGAQAADVKMAANGDFLVAQGGSCGDYLHLYNADGTRKRDPFNPREQLQQDYATVEASFGGMSSGLNTQNCWAMDADGNFATLFRVIHGTEPNLASTDRPPQDVRVRRYNADGSPRGSDLVVIPVATDTQHGYEAITASADGQLIAVIPDLPNPNVASSDVVLKARRIAADGSLSTVFTLNSEDPRLNFAPNLAAAGNGAFAALWYPEHHEKPLLRFYSALNQPQGPAQRFLPSDAPDCETNVVTGFARGNLVSDARGNITVLCLDHGPRGRGAGSLWFRRYNAQGQAVDADVQPVNTTINGTGDHGGQGSLGYGLAMDADGDLVMVWTDGRANDAREVPQDDIRAQRFVGPENVDLSLSMTDSADPVAPGAGYNYLLKASNMHAAVTPVIGSSAGIQALNAAIGSAHNLRISATQAQSVSLNSGSGTDWSCAKSGSVLSCDYLKVLFPGQNAPDLSMAATAPSQGAFLEQSAQIAFAFQPDDRANNNSDCEATLVGTGGTAGNCGEGGDPQLRFEQPTYRGAEGRNNFEVKVLLSHAAPKPITVAFSTSGSANVNLNDQGNDVALNTPSPLQIPIGATSATINVDLINDQEPETEETLSLTLSAPTNAALASPSSTTLTITDPDQDLTPDAFLFVDQQDVGTSLEMVSNSVTISGLGANVPAPLSVEGGEYSLDGDVFTSAATHVVNGAVIKVRHTSASAPGTGVDTLLRVGTGADIFTSTTKAADNTPEAFSFVDVTDVPTNTQMTSNSVTIRGLSGTAAVSVTGGSYSIDGGAFVSTAGTVSNNQQIRVRHTSSPLTNQMVNTTLTVGTLSDTYTSTTSLTAASDSTPNAFDFIDQTGVLPLLPVTSNEVSLAGFNVAVNISVSGGQYSLDGGPFVSYASTVTAGSKLRLRHAAALLPATVTTTTVTVGGVAVDFKSTTLGLDDVPELLRFNDLPSVPRTVEATSNSVLVKGINAAIPIRVTGGSYSINGAPFTAADGTVSNGQTVRVRHTTASTADTVVNTVLTVGAGSDTFSSRTKAEPVVTDTTPDAFSFNPMNDVVTSSQVTSASISIAGINSPAPVTVSGGQYSIGCTASFTSAAGSINNGQTVCLRHTASANADTPTTTTLTVGGVSGSFTSRTRAASGGGSTDTTPDAFSFSNVVDVALGILVQSNPITVSGINAAAPISVTGGQYSIGCNGTFTASAGTVSNGATVCVQHQSASSNSTTVTTTLSIGGVSSSFSSRSLPVVSTAVPSEQGAGAFGLGLLLPLLLALRRRR